MALLIGAFLLMVGLAVGVLVRRPASQTDAATRPPTAARTEAPSTALVIELTDEAMARAGVTVAPVKTGQVEDRLRLPALVEANAYREVDVTALVAGRVADVSAALGDHVQVGQVLAHVYSPQLAEAETQYVALMADLEAAHLEVVRLEKLVAEGVASQRQLEAARAEHTAHAAHVETARAKLALLGVTDADVEHLQSASAIAATATVVSPIAGVITARQANVGLNVDASAKLFTIVDLSTVWVVANAYEQDLGRIRVGALVSVSTRGIPRGDGHVDYIDPQVDPQSRTARVRVELANPGGRFQLGMYADVAIEGSDGPPSLLVPQTSLQTIGDRVVVYVTDSPTSRRFVERAVKVGPSTGGDVAILEGVTAGEFVAATGSFALRAERERLGGK